MRLWAATVLLALSAAATGAQAPRAPIRYVVRFPAPQTNYLEVEARVPTEGRSVIEMMMAVWTPGSYLVREYEKNVEAVTASAGPRTLTVEKIAKNRWRIGAEGAAEITLRYHVYCHEMTVRNDWVDADFAMLNGAPTFMTLAEAYDRPHDVRLELPAAWKTSVTGMPDAPDRAPNHYIAPDFDTLVDSPIVAGNPAIHRFIVDGKPHLLVDVGEDGVFDGARAVPDMQRIVEEDKRFWGSLPYDKYVFFNVLGGEGGGIEHKNSVMMMASRWDTATRDAYTNWLGLVSHEYFHLWNVKRLRPIELGPFDYEHEVYPRTLWVAEGLTDYYGNLQLRRAGLISPREYLSGLSDTIATLQRTPGRLARPLELASFDAWIKQYRPDANNVNSTISYYTKGEVVGFLLDAQVRIATRGAKSLEDVMRLAFARYSGAHGYTSEQFRQTVSEVAGTDLSAWLHRALDTTEELDYTPALEWYGLRFREPRPSGGEAPGWLGAKTRIENGRLIVERVPRDTPAFDAGVNPGDEILGIDEFRVLPEDFDKRLRDFRPGRAVTLLLARRDELKHLRVTLAGVPPDRWTLEFRPNASDDQRARVDAWLRGGR